jgi:hypothetical protein
MNFWTNTTAGNWKEGKLIKEKIFKFSKKIQEQQKIHN